MHRFFFVITLLIFPVIRANSQHSTRISLESNIIRIAPQTGLYFPINLNPKVRLFRSVLIGYQLNSSSEINFRIRFLTVNYDFEGPFSHETTGIKGIEITYGFEKKIRLTKKFYLLGEGGIFYEGGILKGVIIHDYPQVTRVNQYVRYMGIFSEGKLGYQLNDNIIIILSSRIRNGYLKRSPGEKSMPGNKITSSPSEWITIGDPLNSLSVRFYF